MSKLPRPSRLSKPNIRRGDAWEYKPFRAVTDSFTMPALSLTLALTDLYEGIFQ